MPERGFTIIEVLVAILLLAIGLLALAFTGALASRWIAEGGRSIEAATLAWQRAEILRSTSLPCRAGAQGDSTVHGLAVRWRVREGRLQVLVRLATGYAPEHADTFATTVPCWLDP